MKVCTEKLTYQYFTYWFVMVEKFRLHLVYICKYLCTEWSCVFFTICVHLRVLYSLIILFWFSEIYISTIIVNLYSTGISSFQTKPVISVRFTKDLSYAYHRFPYHFLLKVFFFNRNLAGFPYVAITRKFVTFSIAR